MSEYQCYEFIALDRPLTAKEMAEPSRDLDTGRDHTDPLLETSTSGGISRPTQRISSKRYFDVHVVFREAGGRTG